ncbi:MAG: HD-GYP domain-containing protein [Streptosporangiaceae bacterium]
MSVEARRGPTATSSGHALLIVIAGLLVVAAVAEVAARGLVQPRVALAFGGLIVIGEVARINLPGGRESAPLGTAAALSYALLLAVGHAPASHGALQVVTVTATGVVIGALPHVAVARAPRFDEMARRVLHIALAAGLLRPFMSGLPPLVGHVVLLLTILIAVVVVAALFDLLLATVVRAGGLRLRFRTAAVDELRAQGPLAVAVGATGLLIALAVHAMGLVALAIFILPLLVTQIAFRRYAGVRATYLQTIRALSRVTEVGGYVESGHSRRVTQLAVGLSRRLGMSESEQLQLEYAALMHDIGQLSLTEPIPGAGATVLAAPEAQRRIAQLGAEVIEETGVLDRVAEVVRRQVDPYRGDDGAEDGSLPLGSRVIRVANAYDDLVGSSSDPDRQAAALERLRLATARDYDPRVVEALTRLIERGTRPGLGGLEPRMIRSRGRQARYFPPPDLKPGSWAPAAT